MTRALLAAFLTLGCATGLSQAAADRLATSTTLTVNNEYREPVHVYVEHGGTRVRQLGVVESYSRQVFALHRSDAYAGALQLLVIAYTDGTTVRTDAVHMTDGLSFALDFGPMRGQQFLYARATASP